MKRIIALALGALAATTSLAQTHIGVSINQPGVYGRIDIGDVPRPALVLPQPVIISTPRYEVERRPIYLYVPVEHQRHWSRYCGRYSACAQPVYFVQDSWVRERYEREHPGWDRGRHRGWDKHDRRDDKGHRRGHDRGHGRGHD